MFHNYEVSEELTQNKNVVLKGTLLHLVSAVANCSTQENSYGFEANVFNLWDIGTTVDTAPSNYLSVNFYINDKSISNMDIKSNLKVSIDKNVIAYAVIVLDVLAAIKMGDFVKAWNGMSYILDVYLYLHGGPGKLYFQGESMELSKFGRLYYKNVSAHIYLLSCHGAKKNDDGNNVAWGLAGRTNTKVHACLGGVSYLKLLGGKYIARSAFKDNKYGSWSMYYYKNGKRNSMFSSLMGL